MLHYPASTNVTGWVNPPRDESRYVVEVLISVLAYLNRHWRAASAAAIWLNSHTVSWKGENWQKDAWELLGAMSGPLSTMEREMLWQPWRPPWMPRADWIPFEMLLFEAAKLSGSVGGHGEVREKQKGMSVFSNTSCYCQRCTSVKESQSCTSGLSIILPGCLFV